MKRKCLIFPFSQLALNLIEHKNSIEKYEIVSVSSLPGWINGFKPFVSAKGLEIVELTQIDSLKNIDAVIVPPLLDNNFLPEIEKHIKKLNDRKVEIINLSGHLFNGERTTGLSERKDKHDFKDELYGIKSCVIYIAGLGEYCDVDYVEVLIRDSFVKLGVKTKVVSSTWSAELFGFEKIPSFMYDENIDEINKVKLFNRFIHQLEMDDIELIIISIDEPILNYPNSLTTSEYAYRQYLATKACPPDYSIFCIYAKYYLENEIMLLKNNYTKSTGVDLSIMIMSSMAVDWATFKDIESKNVFLKIKEQTVEKFSKETSKNNNFKIVPVSSIHLVIDDILGKLSSNTQQYVML